MQLATLSEITGGQDIMLKQVAPIAIASVLRRIWQFPIRFVPMCHILNIANLSVLDTIFQVSVEVVNKRVTTGLLGSSWIHYHKPGTVAPLPSPWKTFSWSCTIVPWGKGRQYPVSCFGMLKLRKKNLFIHAPNDIRKIVVGATLISLYRLIPAVAYKRVT